MSNRPLTIKQEAFCQAYMRLGDKSAAYREVYSCSKMKPQTVYVKAQELFNNGKVTVRIEELQSKAREIAEKEFNITHKEILRHLGILRNARIDHYVNYDYEEIIMGYDEEEKPIKQMVPRLMFKPFSELTEEQLMCIESIKEGKYGLELKLHGIDWSIEKICKHLGFYEKDNKQKESNIVLFKIPDNGRNNEK